MANKKGKERGRSWFSGSASVMLLLSGGLLIYWFASRETAGIPLTYGELDRALTAARHSSGVTFRKVRVGHAEVTGQITTSDPASDGEANAAKSQTVTFHTQRTGLEPDQDLIR
ncbi:MAG TPA: hypothetical protein VGG61_09345, partial [Gemmataceae bacterium]